MTPAEIEAWYREHGGRAGDPTIDANGITTHRAADGNYINVRRDGTLAMRGFSPPSGESAAAQPSAVSTAQPTPPGGGGMNQQEVEQWIAQNGGPGAVQYNRSSQRIKNPARMRTLADGSDNPDWDPTAPEWIDVQEESWTNSKTGAVLRVSRRPDGASFDVKENKGADPNKPSNNDDTPEKRNAAELQRQRERNAALPPDQDPAYETDAERRKRAEDRIAQQGRDAEAARQRQRQEDADRRGREDQAAQRAPKPVQQPDGSWGYWDAQPGQQPRWVTIQGGPGAETKPIQGPDGSWGYWKPGANGAAPTWMPIEGPKKPQIPANAPQFAPDWNKPGLGIAEYAAAVRARPDLNDEQKRELITQAHQSATSTVNQATGIVNVQEGQRTSDVTQRGQDAQMSANRLNAGMSAFGNALQAAQAATKFSTGPDAGSVLPYYLALSAATGQAFGGFNTPPRVQSGPAVQQMNNMRIPGLGSVLAGAGMPAAGSDQAGRAMAEAQRQQQMAQQGAALPAVTQGVTATNTAANNPTGANVEAANQAVQNGFNQAVGPLLTPPAAPGAPQGMMPTGLGAQALSQSMTGYDPKGTNAALLAAGLDPDIISMMGGIG